jgi:enoyl-CoA hydratase/carnithine racemase
LNDSPDEGTIHISAEGALRVVTFQRPEALNAISLSMHTRLSRLWEELASDPDAKAIVLTGEGRAFSAGGDMEMLAALVESEHLRARVFDETDRIISDMIRCPLPIVVAVNGPAVGLGCSVAISGDVVLIAETAYLADPHVAVGLVAGDGGAALWPVLTSLLRAKEYLFTGDRISAADAVAMGLATRVVPTGEVLDEAMRVATRIAALPAQALRWTKQAMNLHLERAHRLVTPFATSAEQLTFHGSDVREAITRFGRT